MPPRDSIPLDSILSNCPGPAPSPPRSLPFLPPTLWTPDNPFPMRVVVQRPGLFYSDESRDPELIMLGPLRAVARSLAGMELVEVGSWEEAVAALPGADAFIGGGDTAAVIQAAGPSLRWVQVQSAGVEGYPHDALERAGVTLTNAAVVYGPQLADHQMSLILAFSRQLPFLFGAQQEQRWASRSEYPPGELAGQTLLVVGLGGAGLETAKRASGFGMRVIGTRRTPPSSPPPGVERVLGSSRAELHSVLPEADWIAVCCGLNTETLGLFGTREFELMKDTAVITTVARGRVIDTDALVQALNTGAIGGAGLDVTEPEPLPTGHQLWRTPNTIITPHASGHSPVADSRYAALIADNLRLFAEGRPLRNVVNLQTDRLEAKL